MCGFQVQQGFFAVQAASVSRQRAIGAHDPVAGHDHAPGVASNGRTHGTHGLEIADVLRDVAVGHGVAVVHALQRLPNCALKRCAPGWGQGHIKRGALVAELLVQLLCSLEQDGELGGIHPACGVGPMLLPDEPNARQALRVGGQ